MTLGEFFAKCDALVSDANGCKIWNLSLDKDGYPDIIITGAGHKRGHRLVLAREIGRQIKPGFCSLHTCDVRSCVEPSHLYEGTRKQNAEDRVARGSCPVKGDTHWAVTNPEKLTTGDAHWTRKHPEKVFIADLNAKRRGTQEAKNLAAKANAARWRKEGAVEQYSRKMKDWWASPAGRAAAERRKKA